MTAQTGVSQLAKDMGIDQDAFDRQCHLELKSSQWGTEAYEQRRDSVLNDKHKDTTTLKPQAALMRNYIPKITRKIQEATLKRGQGGSGSPATREVLSILREFDPDRLAWLALRWCFNCQHPVAQPFATACIGLGKQVAHDFEYMMFEEKAKGYLTKVEEGLRTAHLRHRHNVLNHARQKVEIRDEDGNVVGYGIEPLNWKDSQCFVAGQILIGAVEFGTPLFKKVTRRQRKRTPKGYMMSKQDFLEATDECVQWIAAADSKLAQEAFVALPFAIPPKPWKGTRGGGFWTHYRRYKTRLLRTRSREPLKRAAEHGVDTVNKALNVIQGTKWRINKRILDVIRESWGKGLGGTPVGDMEHLELRGTNPLDDPCPWDDVEIERMKKVGDPRWKHWCRERAEAHDKWSRENSARMSMLWKRRITEYVEHEPELYLAWNCDYRGRIYCFQPHINPQMDDVGKALLEFAEGKELDTSEAVDCFFIHGANEFGFDKAPLPERVAWVHEHRMDILASAENPYDNRFWTEADKPYCFLAFCFEFAELDRVGGHKFKSHLPVQVDGTCSGLQHFSALLRDEAGGAKVNLSSGEQKADVYAEVAEIAKEINRKNFDSADKEFAIVYRRLLKELGRKMTKRNVMTICYGATKPGFADQLVDLCRKEDIDLGGVDMMKLCRYMADVNWKAVSQALTKAREGMDYLQKVADFLAANQLHTEWSTPAGLKVMQDYRKTASKRINTWYGKIRIRHRIQEELEKKDRVGSRNGIAPNFIHSMDAAHLMLTAIRCNEAGIRDFSFIHDSFGTHAADMPVMNRILRETFDEIYAENWLEKFTDDVRAYLPAELSEDFEQLVVDHMPTPGDYVVNTKESCFFFC